MTNASNKIDNWTLYCTPDMVVTINGKRGIYSGICEVTNRYVFSMFDGSMVRLYTLDNVLFD